MTQADWLTFHPYLEPMANFHSEVAALAKFMPNPGIVVPNWEGYRAEFQSGVPLLLSSGVELELKTAARTLATLVDHLASIPLPQSLAEESRTLQTQLHQDQNKSYRVLQWLVYGDEFATPCSGLLRYLGWTTLASHLRPLLDAFAQWRDDEKWLRSYCPACGSPPCMAHLSGTESGRRRLLCCALCGTRWCYRRTGCPFCENSDDRQLAVLTAEGEHGLRIDTCQSCGGYLKTYAGNGSEDFFLADWSSIHLDFLARDHGLKRIAASLYDL